MLQREQVTAPKTISPALNSKRYEVVTINPIALNRVALTESAHFAFFIYGEYQHDGTPVAVYEQGILKAAANTTSDQGPLESSSDGPYDAVKNGRILNVLKHQIRAVVSTVTQLAKRFPDSQERHEVRHEVSVLLDELKTRNLAPVPEVKELIVDALNVDGAHHKQWYLWKIAAALGLKLDDQWDEEDSQPDEGRAP